MTITQQRFHGYQQTSLLWQNELEGIWQFHLDSDRLLSIDSKVDSKLRLGNYVERLFSYQLKQQKQIHVLKENAQIIHHKTTLGEIDVLLIQNNQPIHIEIAYKFYIYDPNEGNTFLSRWIGPNRRDRLIQKLAKIKQKQFPLLYSDACRSLLEELNLDTHQIQQKTYFKAQLFIPYASQIEFPLLNSNCISGFYINKNQLSLFDNCKFYIPKKLDWLIIPYADVDWINFATVQDRILEFLKKQSSPLLWIKYPNGEINKVFVIW